MELSRGTGKTGSCPQGQWEEGSSSPAVPPAQGWRRMRKSIPPQYTPRRAWSVEVQDGPCHQQQNEALLCAMLWKRRGSCMGRTRRWKWETPFSLPSAPARCPCLYISPSNVTTPLQTTCAAAMKCRHSFTAEELWAGSARHPERPQVLCCNIIFKATVINIQILL